MLAETFTEGVRVSPETVKLTPFTPGATLIFTDRPVDPTTQSPPNFQILVAQKGQACKNLVRYS